MTVATQIEIEIDTIEAALTARGMETAYTGMEHGTSYTITGETKVIEILDGVSGDYFRPEHVLEVIVYGHAEVYGATREFEDVETVEEFMAAVAGIMS